MGRKQAVGTGTPGNGMPFWFSLFVGPSLIMAYLFAWPAISPSPPGAAQNWGTGAPTYSPSSSPAVTTTYVSLPTSPVVAPVALAPPVKPPSVERTPPAPAGRETGSRQYVSGRKVPLRAEPNAKGRVLDRYEPGQAVDVLSRSGDWTQIRHVLTQREGWIQAKRLREAPPAEKVETKPAPVSPALGVAAI